MADAAIEAMGIAHLSGSPCSEISGGERQQASIARVMVQSPRVVMMDEPTSALDFGNQMRVIGMIRRLASEGYAVIMTTHTPDHVIMLNDTVALLDRSGALRVGGTDESDDIVARRLHPQRTHRGKPAIGGRDDDHLRPLGSQPEARLREMRGTIQRRDGD